MNICMDTSNFHNFIMAQAKKRKVGPENRNFKEKWVNQFAFILHPKTLKPLCLICNSTIAIIKLDNIRRRYQTKHGTSFDANYPMESNKQKEKVKRMQEDIVIFDGPRTCDDCIPTCDMNTWEEYETLC